MTKYPDEAYSPVMEVYGKLPPELKPKANALMGDYAKKYPQGEAPPDQMLRDLQALASSQHSLEEKVAGHGSHPNDIGGKAAEAYQGAGHGNSRKTRPLPDWVKLAAAAAFFSFLGAPYLSYLI